MTKLLSVLIGVGVLVGVFLLALPTILHKVGLHPEYTGKSVELPGKRALVKRKDRPREFGAPR